MSLTPRRRDGAGRDGSGQVEDAQRAAGADVARAVVRLRIAGKVESVDPHKAARLLTTRQAELPPDATVAEVRAVLAAEEDRQAVSVRALKTELIARGGSGEAANKFGQQPSGFGRLSGEW